MQFHAAALKLNFRAKFHNRGILEGLINTTHRHGQIVVISRVSGLNLLILKEDGIAV